MAHLAWIERNGGPEVIGWRDLELGPPGPGEVRLRIEAIGLNYIDVYFRSGLYPIDLPSPLGVEAAGVVEAIGPDVGRWRPGDRAGIFGPILGAYATELNIAADALLPIPDEIGFEAAAASLLKGCTAEFLVERCARVRPGQAVLVYAAAGGAGNLLVQWLKAVGAFVIGVVSGGPKAEIVRRAGADAVIEHSSEDVVQRCLELTGGQGADIVFDSVGAATWSRSLAATRRRGMIVSFGNTSGPVASADLGALSRNGSLFVTRPMLYDYYREAGEREQGVARLWQMIVEGKIHVAIDRYYPLADLPHAHRELEEGQTTGAAILVPSPT